MRNKKAQILMIVLWVLVILTLLATSIGFQVSNQLRMSRYLKDRLRSYYSARAAVNIAIKELEKDANSYDSLTEAWANNEDGFKDITLGSETSVSADISYLVEEGNGYRRVFGLVDEERKININIADKELLVILLDKCMVPSSNEVADNILIWRGDIPDDKMVYDEFGYPAKGSSFSNIAELELVKGINRDDYARLKDLVTVYGDGLVNINTASFDSLQILARSIAQKLSFAESYADDIVMKVVDLRNAKGFFKGREDIDIEFTGEEEDNIFNQLMNEVVFKSSNFLIQANGYANKITSGITSVYARSIKKTVYWYER